MAVIGIDLGTSNSAAADLLLFPAQKVSVSVAKPFPVMLHSQQTDKRW